MGWLKRRAASIWIIRTPFRIFWCDVVADIHPVTELVFLPAASAGRPFRSVGPLTVNG